MRISVVIPCFNEAGSISLVLHGLPQGIHEAVVVDNGSSDATALVARRAGAKIVSEARRGYGRAIKTGFENAAGDIIATLDGDGQYPAGMIEKLTRYLISQQLDFVSGARFPLENPYSMSRTRIVGNQFLTMLANVLFGLALRDSQSGMWVFRKSVLREILLESDDMAFSQELKIKVATHPRLRFGEHHIPYSPRVGASKLDVVRHGIANTRFLFALRFSRSLHEAVSR